MIRFGDPVDPFGDEVDEQGESLAPDGRVIDPATYVSRRGTPVVDHARDAAYTRELGHCIAKRRLRAIQASRACSGEVSPVTLEILGEVRDPLPQRRHVARRPVDGSRVPRSSSRARRRSSAGPTRDRAPRRARRPRRTRMRAASPRTARPRRDAHEIQRRRMRDGELAPRASPREISTRTASTTWRSRTSSTTRWASCSPIRESRLGRGLPAQVEARHRLAHVQPRDTYHVRSAVPVDEHGSRG